MSVPKVSSSVPCGLVGGTLEERKSLPDWTNEARVRESGCDPLEREEVIILFISEIPPPPRPPSSKISLFTFLKNCDLTMYLLIQHLKRKEGTYAVRSGWRHN